MTTVIKPPEQVREQELIYTCTNESLDAIVSGLDLSSDDNIMSVGSSGDQAFALLEKAGLVYVIDSSPVQIQHIKHRILLLEIGDYEGFLETDLEESRNKRINPRPNLSSRNRYFLFENRLDRIRDNLHNLSIEAGDISSFFFQEGFSKIYVSNAVGYKQLTRIFRKLYDPKEQLRRVSLNLSPEGLMYVTNNHSLVRLLDSGSEDLRIHGLVLDEERTGIAKFLEPQWSPGVYRKAA